MKILIAYDGSANSDAALVDLHLAGLPTDTQAVVLSVLDDMSMEFGQNPPGAAEARERQLAVAQHGADQLRMQFPGWLVTAEVRVGSPAWEIIKRAEIDTPQPDQRPFDLVVVGSRGHGRFKRLLLGSVAHRVLTTLRVSVRVARGRLDRLHPQPMAAAPHPPRLIVGVDGSPDANAAVESVASRVWPEGTRIVVASFETGPVAIASQWEPNFIWSDEPAATGIAGSAGRPAQQFVADAAEILRRRCPATSVATLVRQADPRYGLLGAAETWDGDGADCIFVGAAGLRGVERFLLGSVSTSVALNAACSVEIARRAT